jgi:hypothetical protein
MANPMRLRFTIRDLLWLAVVTVLASAITVSGCHESENLDQFEISKDGDGLLVPVKIGSDVRHFLIDTGSTVTVFDLSLLRGQPQANRQIQTAGTDISVPMFDAPAATLGSHRLQDSISSVAGLDLKELRSSTGLDFYGIVGMDFLRHFVIELKFDKGILNLKRELGKQIETPKLGLTIDEFGSPFVKATVHAWSELEFMIDTGNIGHDSGELEARTCRYISQIGHLRSLGSSGSTTATGPRTECDFEADSITLGEHLIVNPIFSEGNGNRLSLHCLSRFNVTIDFPNDCIYLQENGAFRKLDERNLSGMHLKRQEEGIVVDSIDPNGAADNARIKAGDRIIRLNDLDATHSRLYQLESLMSQNSSALKVVAFRAGNQFQVSLELKETKKIP